jgi:hypothetical protein
MAAPKMAAPKIRARTGGMTVRLVEERMAVGRCGSKM